MRVHEYFRILVVNAKLVTYEYFMDYIQDWEIELLLEMSNESYRNDWETARYIAYYNAIMSGNLKKQYSSKTMTELFPLPYDDRYKIEEDHNIEISNNEIDMLKQRSNAVANRLFKK